VSPARRNAAALILAVACWGVGTVISKQAVAEIPPLTLLPIQLAISLAFLALVAHPRGEHLPSDRPGRLAGRLGLLNPGLAYALGLLGSPTPSASSGSPRSRPACRSCCGPWSRC